MEEKFTWVETYGKLAEKLREYKDRQDELIAFMNEMRNEGIPIISTDDRYPDGTQRTLDEIDPFTFFANFNRGIKTEHRIQIIRHLTAKWDLSCRIPSDFSGIPIVNNQHARFFTYKKERGLSDISNLWQLFGEALDRDIMAETFNAVLKQKCVSYNITMGLFWIAPKDYINLDSTNRAYLIKNGVEVKNLSDYETYQEYLRNVRSSFDIPFYMISHDAWLSGNDEPDIQMVEEPTISYGKKYWLFAPGRGGEHWDEFYEEGIMAIGWDSLGDLHKYKNKEAIAKALRDEDLESDSSKKNNATSNFAFCNEMRIGDIVFAKVGRDRIIGYGIISSDYEFDESREYFKHVRQVDWKKKGEWTVSAENNFALKTITDVTRFNRFIKYLESLLGIEHSLGDLSNNLENDTVAYWWLNANPRIWDLTDPPIGTRQTYTSHNTKGNKRRVYQYFQKIKPNDLLIGYVASPTRQVVALCKVTKGLHESAEGEAFEFEKIEQFSEPVPLLQLQSVPELKDCEPLINNQGSLFKLTTKEYETIRSIIDEKEENNTLQMKENPLFTLEQCSEVTGLPISKLQDWQAAIERKGQAIFYGPPGTGKTFIADHIARHIIGEGNGFVELIQFHPAYAYEEFMQGIRPDTDEKGNLVFDLKPGRFLSFCRQAKPCSGPCVLIIDEINRANLSKVFGELMYLLEYRNKEIPLANGTRFSIPSNVRIIGTMNTADRSIALVDFALRRRFAFLELSPDFEVLRSFQSKCGFDASGLIALLREVNTKINDKNFSLGISFFMTDKLPEKLEHIWQMEIETYLEEYFFTQPETVAAFRWDVIHSRIGV
ncbi:MAG: EVE domain-containing protein [Desulfatiglans sp.]|mgnify:CR=1 FL=1|jgi:5-methylcytosine-specific restriction protein B|nr:EVE domain-containing protein [Desulfatiglans sp.]